MKSSPLWILLVAVSMVYGQRQITVAPGSWGDCNTISEAVAMIDNPNSEPVEIYVYPGLYQERVEIPRGMTHVSLVGVAEDRTQVILQGGASDVAVFKAGGDDLLVQNITIENTAGATAGPQQAVYVDGKRQAFENVLILGWQDTLGVWNGCVSYFHGCDIWGSVDFIYSGGTAVFDRCDITQRRNTGGPLTAPSTPEDVTYGLVFLDCNITRTEDVADNTSTLMRPWRPYGMSAFLRCTLDDHMTAKGWSEWDGREDTCRAIEYGSVDFAGDPVSMDQRAEWVKILSPREAANYTLDTILDGWDPTGVAVDVNEAPALQRANLEALIQEDPNGAASLDGQGDQRRRGGTTGGADGEVVTVTTWDELADYAADPDPLVILIEGELVAKQQGSIPLASDKTLIGVTADAALVGRGLSMNGVENIVIRYLTLRDNAMLGDYDGKANDYDALAMRNCHHIWVDHCHLSRAGDGLLDMTYGTAYVTTSWSVLSFHNKAAAVTGRNDSETPLTFDHCWFNNTVQRNAAVTAGQVHTFNCLFTGVTGYGMNARTDTQMLLENCVFIECHNPYYAEKGGQLQADGCLLTDCTGKTVEEPLSWSPAYTYRLDEANDVQALVTAQAGPTGDACPDTGPSLGINFGPADQRSLYGYLADDGTALEVIEGGYSYGWNHDHTGASYWRETLSYKDDQTWVPVDADLRRNGGHDFDNGNRVWELSAIEGWYDVHLVCGDPGDPRHPDDDSVNPERLNHLLLEGTRLEDPDGALPNDYDEYQVRIYVNDDFVTLAQAQDGDNAAICFLEIAPAFTTDDDPFQTPTSSGRPSHR